MGEVSEEVGVNLEGVEVVVVVRSGRERSVDDRSATNVTWTEVAKRPMWFPKTVEVAWNTALGVYAPFFAIALGCSSHRLGG